MTKFTLFKKIAMLTIVLLIVTLLTGVVLRPQNTWKSGATVVTLSENGTLRIKARWGISVSFHRDGIQVKEFRIRGKGAMKDYYKKPPWHKFASLVTELVIDDGVTYIGVGAFVEHENLTSVTIPSGVRSIGNGAFYECTNLTAVIIPNTVTSIHAGAFTGDYFLKFITNRNPIPPVMIGEKSKPYMGLSYRGWEKKLNENDSACLYVPIGSIDAYRSAEGWNKFECIKDTAVAPIFVGGVLFNKGQDELIVYPKGKRGAYAIPSGVRSIKSNAFTGSVGLTSITIPSSVTEIGYETFKGCAGLTSITIPSSVTNIDQRAFFGCTGLTSVTIPSSVTKIGYNAFDGCTGLTSVTIPDNLSVVESFVFASCTSLTSVTIGRSVTRIAYNAFANSTAITSVISLSPEPPKHLVPDVYKDRHAFSGIDFNNACLYVPEGSIEAYRAAEHWNDFGCIKNRALILK